MKDPHDEKQPPTFPKVADVAQACPRAVSSPALLHAMHACVRVALTPPAVGPGFAPVWQRTVEDARRGWVGLTDVSVLVCIALCNKVLLGEKWLQRAPVNVCIYMPFCKSTVLRGTLKIIV